MNDPIVFSEPFLIDKKGAVSRAVDQAPLWEGASKVSIPCKLEYQNIIWYSC